MGFWILAVLAAVSIVIALGYALFAPAHRAAKASADFDVDVYRDQLKELERDQARGVIDATDAERAKVEISRRLLDADRAAQAGTSIHAAPRWLNGAALGGIALVVVGGGLWLYSDLGAPGYGDMPLAERKAAASELRETRPDQETVESQRPAWTQPDGEFSEDYLTLVTQLRDAVARRPDDPRGLALLAQHEAQLGNFAGAWRAKARLVELEGDSVTATEYAELAELLILAAGGYVSPEAETALTRALRLEADNDVARYYTGLMFAQTGRPDLAFRLWRVLFETSEPDAPWMEPIRAELPDLAAAAGVNYTMPGTATPQRPGPSAADIEAAGDMSDADRSDMIRGMVNQLSDRVTNEGGTADEWARLISSLAVLGEMERVATVWDDAQRAFWDKPEELEIIREAAARAGVAE